MAQLVAAYAVPHTPSFIADAARLGPSFETVQHFSRIRAHLAAAKADVVVMVQNDHFNTFFFNNWPTFAIGKADQTTGPSDQTPGMPIYHLAIQSELARHIHRICSENDFDFASSEDLEVDHGVLVPLHFLTPAMDKAVLQEMGIDKIGDRVRLFVSIKKLRTKAYANQKKRNRVCRRSFRFLFL